jgi:myotubularin-related protein 1/2
MSGKSSAALSSSSSAPTITASSLLVRLLAAKPARKESVPTFSSCQLYATVQFNLKLYSSPLSSDYDSSSSTIKFDYEYIFHNVLKENEKIKLIYMTIDGEIIGQSTVEVSGMIPAAAAVLANAAAKKAQANGENLVNNSNSLTRAQPTSLPPSLGYNWHEILDPKGQLIGHALISVSRYIPVSAGPNNGKNPSGGSGGWFLSKNKKQQIKRETEHREFLASLIHQLINDKDSAEFLKRSITYRRGGHDPEKRATLLYDENSNLPVAFNGSNNVFGANAPYAPHFDPEMYKDLHKKRGFFGFLAQPGGSKGENHRKIAARAIHSQNLGQIVPGCLSADDLLAIVNMFRDDLGRSLFTQYIIPSSFPQPVSAASLRTLTDIFHACLRSANNTRDFHSCKILLDQSLNYLTQQNNVQHRFLYNRIKGHEVFRSADFWANILMDVFPAERKQLELANLANSNPSNLDYDCVRDLLCGISLLQHNAAMKIEAISAFAEKQMQSFQLPQLYRQQITDFYHKQTQIINELLAPKVSADFDSENDHGASSAGDNTATSSASITTPAHIVQPAVASNPAATSVTAVNSTNNPHNLGVRRSIIRINTVISTCVGEYTIGKVDEALCASVYPPWKGTLYLTNFQLIFHADEPRVNTEPRNLPLLYVPIGSIHRYDYTTAQSAAFSSTLTLSCRDFRTVCFAFNCAAVEGNPTWDFIKLMKRHAFCSDLKKTFAFVYRDLVLPHHDGWSVYSAENEAKRLNLLGSGQFRLFSNENFSFIPTYPAQIIVPSALSDEELAKVKSFRSKGRIPAVIYQYPHNSAVILRSSQPNVGITFGRCAADEKLLFSCGVRVIYDARPKANAVANQAKGGGYENIDNYKQVSMVFLDIHNIHVMRESFAKFYGAQQAAHSATDDYYMNLHQSHWLKHVRQVLLGSQLCAQSIRRGESLLIHCSDGWDRTSQLTSLAQLILEPFYRSRAGFALLISREWLHFGHQFNKRCGPARQDKGDHERSPIFLQFLDCCWQLLQQQPTAFEFNERYLNFLAEHLYSNKFGTFLHNNERDREGDKAKQATVSIFTELIKDNPASLYQNPFYRPNSHNFLQISLDFRVLRVWPWYYRENRTLAKHYLPNTESSTANSLLIKEQELVLLEKLALQQAQEINELKKRLNLPVKEVPSSLREMIQGEIGSSNGGNEPNYSFLSSNQPGIQPSSPRSPQSSVIQVHPIVRRGSNHSLPSQRPVLGPNSGNSKTKHGRAGSSGLLDDPLAFSPVHVAPLSLLKGGDAFSSDDMRVGRASHSYNNAGYTAKSVNFNNKPPNVLENHFNDTHGSNHHNSYNKDLTLNRAPVAKAGIIPAGSGISVQLHALKPVHSSPTSRTGSPERGNAPQRAPPPIPLGNKLLPTGTIAPAANSGARPPPKINYTNQVQ